MARLQAPRAMPPRQRTRRESKPECQVFVRPMMQADGACLYDLVYGQILVRQCYDMLLANVQKINFHFTIGLVSWTAYSLQPSIPFALVTGIIIYPLFLFILARFVMLPIDAHFSKPDDLVQGMYEYWSKEMKGRNLFVAELNGRVVAMVAIQQVSSEVAEVQRLATAKAFERRGIGTTLMKHVINLCRDSEYSQLAIDVNETSLPARLLCKQLGFVEKPARSSGFGFFKVHEYEMALNEDRRRRTKRSGHKRHGSES